MDRKIIPVGIAVLAIAIFIAALAIPNIAKPKFSGAVFSPASPAYDINLSDHNGQPYKLSQSKGKLVLIFFGYTNCPDECPLTMAKLNEVFDLLNEQGENIQVLLITTDPARDTPEKLKAYLSSFHSSFLGLTGSSQELQKVYQDYGVTVMDDGETHSTRIYLIDRSGYLRLTFSYELSPGEIASDLRYLLSE